MENNNTQTPDLHQTNINPEAEEQTIPQPTETTAEGVTPVASLPKRTGTRKLAWILGGLVVLVLGGVGANVVLSKSGVVKTSQQPSSAAATTTPVASSPSATPASSSDSAITTDLQSADTSLNQSSTDQSSGDSALNDASQQVTVPTN